MQPESYLKCSCDNCGAHIEFPREALGQSVACPHCGWKTNLGQLVQPVAEAPAVVRAKSRRPIFLIAFCGFALAAAMAFGILAARKKIQPSEVEKTTPPAKIVEDAAPEKAQARKRPNRRTKKSESKPEFESNGLQVFRVALEKSSSRLIYVTGAVRNQSTRQRFGVKVELNLFDELGAKLGSATDYVQVIEPHKEWKFRAMVTEPKTASAKVAAITEE